MRRIWSAVAIATSLILDGSFAYACLVQAPFRQGDIDKADLVVTGRVTQYELIQNPPPAKNNTIPLIEQLSRLPREYARFQLAVDEVVYGPIVKKVTVLWTNETGSLPENLPASPLFMALRSSTPKLSAFSGVNPSLATEPGSPLFFVLQASCAPAFIFEAQSNQANILREKLAALGKRP